MKYLGARAATLAVLFVGAAGCAASDDEGLDNEAHVSAPIVDGSTASAYPEAALLSLTKQGVVRGYCSGAVIAPQVVLTAGHCVDGFDGFSVTAPFLNQEATGSSAETLDWKSTGSTDVNRDQHDVGLVYLDHPITMPQYPVLARAPLPDGSSVVNIGRIDNGKLSRSALFVSKPLTVVSAALVGFPYDYVSKSVIESGDSGGPVEVPGTTPHALVAVNSGAGSGQQVLARVDLVNKWITERIAAHGGGGATEPAPAVTGECKGPAEKEPNGDFRAPNPVGASVCGSLSGADRQDWYSWSTTGANPYTVKLAATGDAGVVMWKRVGNGYARVSNTTPLELSHVASAPGTYVVAVFTLGSGAPQSYTLTVEK